MIEWSPMRSKLIPLLALCAITALAESKHPADETAIRQRLATYTEARNHSDAHAEALCYTEDGDFRALAHPAEAAPKSKKPLAVSAPGYAFSLTVETIRFLDSNVAIADTHVVAGPPEHKVDMLGSYVMVKQGNAWLIGAARIARTPAF